MFKTSLYIYYALSFVFVEQTVCHEPILGLINVFMFLASCFVVTLTVCDLFQWPSIACMSPQSYCGDMDNGSIGLSG